MIKVVYKSIQNPKFTGADHLQIGGSLPALLEGMAEVQGEKQPSPGQIEIGLSENVGYIPNEIAI